MAGNVLFDLLVYVLGAVEAWRTARTDTVGAERLDCAFLDQIRVDEVVVVVSGKVRDGAAIGEL